jgi:hypothetical protein
MVEFVHGKYIQIFFFAPHGVFDDETSKLICVCSMQEMNPGRDQENLGGIWRHGESRTHRRLALRGVALGSEVSKREQHVARGLVRALTPLTLSPLLPTTCQSLQELHGLLY